MLFLAFVVLGLVSSVLSQELSCVEWDVKP